MELQWVPQCPQLLQICIWRILRKKALALAPHPPSVWFRYVDDTFVVLHEYNIESFTSHINSIDPNIKFTFELEEDDRLPFLDTLVHLNDDGSLRLTIYRKPTHTDRYLNFNSNHHIQHKRSVVRSLMHRSNIVTGQSEKIKEQKHIKRALKANGYEDWALHIPKPKAKQKENQHDHHPKQIKVAIPYVHLTSDRIAHILRKHGVSFYYKPFNTLRSMLVHPKDPNPRHKTCGAIYQIDCSCGEKYVGETARSLEARF